MPDVIVVVARSMFNRVHTHVVEIHSRLTLRVRRRARPFTRKKKSYKTNKRKGHTHTWPHGNLKQHETTGSHHFFRPDKKRLGLSQLVVMMNIRHSYAYMFSKCCGWFSEKMFS
jgi:hypothetical protein